MKTILTRLCLLLASVLASLVQADDTEVFFASAGGGDSENQPKANVVVLLDTSGSMKWCREPLDSGYSWCQDEESRRIDMTIQAFNSMVDGLSPNINLAVGRFTGASGGKIIFPATAMTEGSKKAVKKIVVELDSDGDPDGDPAGSTPTHEAYYEMARYMLGKSSHFGSDLDQAVCVEYGQQQECRDVQTGWGEWQVSSVPCYPGNDCRREYGGWQKTANDGATACDLNQHDICRATREGPMEDVGYCDVNESWCYVHYGNWSDWSDQYCDSGSRMNPSDVCQRQGYGRNREYRTRQKNYRVNGLVYYQRTREYQTRNPVYQQQCSMVDVCLETRAPYQDGAYQSPLNASNQCERNHIVVMTDGEPNADDDIAAMDGLPGCDINDSSNSFDCQVSLARFLNNRGEQDNEAIHTHQVGLYMDASKFCDTAEESCADVDSNGNDITVTGPEGGKESDHVFMDDIARAGGGNAYSASDAASLSNAFLEILDLVDKNSRSLTSPGVAVNQMNRFQHLDQLYYSVFEPAEINFWEGNLKKYRLADNQIHATNGPAVDPDTGYFRRSAKSYWSDVVDGYDAKLGGARDEVSDRVLFYESEDGIAGESLAQVQWNRVGKPGGLEASFFGLADGDSEERLSALVDKLQTQWGDPLHSVPLMVNYGTRNGKQDNLLFVSNNGGMLHAVDADSGAEKFAFMPHQFISKANQFSLDSPALSAGGKRPLYGLDGSWVAWRQPGATSTTRPKAVYIYGGMRRGGDDYYALDVSNVNAPKLLWKITGGSNSGDFQQLGQTWSTPTLTQIPVGEDAAPMPVLIFGGGYDSAQHDNHQGEARNFTGDNVGNAVYIVNAKTGAKLWSASSKNADKTVSSMRWSIPGGIAVVDLNLDGLADHLYFADLGGQLFRVDIDASGAGEHGVHLLAELSGDDAASNRRFYEAPAVGYLKEGNSRALYVAAGSGYRAHPLDTSVEDGFFVIRDDSVFRGAAPQTVTPDDLTALEDGDDVADSDDNGWYYLLANGGEKALSSPVIFNGTIRFTTYSPSSGDLDDNVCTVRYGRSYLHGADMKTGAPALRNNDGTLTGERKQELKQTTPPPPPVLVSDGEGGVGVIVGTEVVDKDDLGAMGLRKRRWYQMDKDQAGNFRN